MDMTAPRTTVGPSCGGTFQFILIGVGLELTAGGLDKISEFLKLFVLVDLSPAVLHTRPGFYKGLIFLPRDIPHPGSGMVFSIFVFGV